MKRDRDLRPACQEYEHELVLYYYGECAPPNRERLEGHLEVCTACKDFIGDLRLVLPLTVKPDEPSEVFWQTYSRELKNKLAAAKPRSYWQRVLSSLVSPWPVPVMATALALVIAVGLIFTRDRWQRPDAPPAQEALLEVLPLAENLEFFTAMEILDSMDLIDDGLPGKGAA